MTRLHLSSAQIVGEIHPISQSHGRGAGPGLPALAT